MGILTTINLKRNNTQTHKITYTNYKKADWTQFTEFIDTELANTITEDLNPHQSNKIITSTINTADKLYIPKGNIKQTHQPLPEDIRTKIRDRNTQRQNNNNNNNNNNNTIQHHTTPYTTIQHHTTPYNIIQHQTTPYNTIQHHTTPYNIIQHHTTPNNTIQLNTTPYNTIQLQQHHTTQYKAIQHHTT